MDSDDVMNEPPTPETGEDRPSEVAAPTASPNADTGANVVSASDSDGLRQTVVAAIQTVFDPEIPVNIYELGLIYDLDFGQDGNIHVQMTLTSPACPVAGSLPGEVENRIREVEGVNEVTLELVWDPPWNPDMMSEEARLELGLI